MCEAFCCRTQNHSHTCIAILANHTYLIRQKNDESGYMCKMHCCRTSQIAHLLSSPFFHSHFTFLCHFSICTNFSLPNFGAVCRWQNKTEQDYRVPMILWGLESILGGKYQINMTGRHIELILRTYKKTIFMNAIPT
jgi:hypothetical protein